MLVLNLNSSWKWAFCVWMKRVKQWKFLSCKSGKTEMCHYMLPVVHMQLCWQCSNMGMRPAVQFSPNWWHGSCVSWTQEQTAAASHNWDFCLYSPSIRVDNFCWFSILHSCMGQRVCSIFLFLISSVFLLQHIMHSFSGSWKENGVTLYLVITLPSSSNSKELTSLASKCDISSVTFCW